jgi:hypothetical protein
LPHRPPLRGVRGPLPTPTAQGIALVKRFRAAVADEVEMDTQLPRDLDTQLFAYFDQLQEARVQALASEKSAQKKAATGKAGQSIEGGGAAVTADGAGTTAPKAP